MAYKVLIPQDVAQPGKDYLRERGYEIKMGSGITAENTARFSACIPRIRSPSAGCPRDSLSS